MKKGTDTMKKNLFVLLGIFLIIISILASLFYHYQKMLMLAKKENQKYESYTQNAISGSSLMTLINKVIDQNEKNQVQKNDQNRYIENSENSIRIEIKFIESDKTYDMEAIASLGSENFIKNYNNMQFQCTKKEYHETTKQIKFMLFEQI